MYTKWFGFTEQPFNVTPNPKFLFLSKTHREVLATLIYCVENKKGFVLITGEVGTGKTTIINSFIERSNIKNKIIVINAAKLNFNSILKKILKECYVTCLREKITKLEAIERLKSYAINQIKNNGNVTIVIDEAQNLTLETIENLRLLSNIETEKSKLLQIILCGQPELGELLRKYELRQFVQRISMRRVLVPLNEKETYEYINHHLRLVGHKENKIFDQSSMQRIWHFSQGIPRKINILCDNALLIAYALNKNKVTKRIIQEAIQDLQNAWQESEKTHNSYTQSLDKIKKVHILIFIILIISSLYMYINSYKAKNSIILGSYINNMAGNLFNDDGSSDIYHNIKKDYVDKNKYTLIQKNDEYKNIMTIKDINNVKTKNNTLYFRVKKGDTLYKIIDKIYTIDDKNEYNEILTRIVGLNNDIKDPNKIEINQIIELPTGDINLQKE